MGVAVTLAAAMVFPNSLDAATDDVRTVAARVAQAYGIGDVQVLDALWSAQSAAAARRLRVEFKQTELIQCHELKGVTIDSVSGDDATTSVRATVVRLPETKHLSIKLRREGDQWRLTDVMPAERVLARQLVADPSKWSAVTNDETELLTHDLAVALSEMSTPGMAAVRPAEARVAAAALQKLAEFRGDRLTRSLALTAEATIADVQNDLPRAKARVGEALALARETGDAEAIARALIVQSRAFERSVNELTSAIDAMQQALAVLDRLENRQLAAFVLGNLGNLKLKAANYADALTYLQRSAALSKEIDDVNGVMKTETAQGLLLQIESNDELAVVHLLRAIELGGNDPANDAWIGQTYINLAQSYTALGRDADSMVALRKAEELGRRAKAPIVIGETHRLLGSAYRRAKDYVSATRELEQALSTFEAAKRIHFIPGAMSELALTRLEAGDAKDAVARADRCADYSRSVNEEYPFIECRTFAGEAHRALGENDAALAALREAIEASEVRRLTIVGDARQRARFLQRTISPYRDAAEILAERGDVEAALEMTEQAKARSLLDILGGDVSHVRVLTPTEEQRNSELAAHIAALNRKLREEKSKPAADALAGELNTARADYESYQLLLDAAHPRRRALEGSVPIAKPADLAPLLGKSTAIIEYAVSGDHTRAYVLTADRVESFRLAGARELDPLVTRFADALAHDDLAYRKDAQALYAMLVQPLEKSLHGRKTLCIVPDGSLWRLPFEALLDRERRFVVESRAVYYAPSMSVLAQVTRRGERAKAATTLLAVGNPTARGRASIEEAAGEVRALRALYGAAHSHVFVGKDATEHNVKGEMESARVLHFAAHAILNEENPMYSEVVLAESSDTRDDGLLAAWEIMRLDLRADIAVLSACDTARGRLAVGEGVIGFTWALFAAGCPSSVVSEWKVDSASTKRLMVAFHRALLASHEPSLAKAEALRSAKLSLLRDPKTRHPFYWSPFVLVGSARRGEM